MNNVIPFHRNGMSGMGYGSSYGSSYGTTTPAPAASGGLTAPTTTADVTAGANAAASVLAVALTAEAAQNAISQQKANAQALETLNAQRAAQGLAPLSTLTATMSPVMLLLLAAGAFLFMGSK
jgi:uncharacterized protein YkwD